LSSEYKAKDFLVLIVDTDREDDGAKKIADQAAQSDFPVLGDKYNIVAKRYMVTKLPVAYLIDESQKVAKVNIGYDDSAYADMHAAVRQLLGVAAADPTPASVSAFLKKGGATPTAVVATPASQPITINSTPETPPAPVKPVKGKKLRPPKKK